MNIILIGFRCSGKTTIGKILSERLSRKFIDVDDYIESKINMTIRQIFEAKGESYFRLLESDMLSELSKLDGKIIATGGGAVLKYKNIHNLKRNGIIIFLEVDPDSAYERIKKNKENIRKRPRLTNKDLYTEIKEQLEFRRPYYLNTADFVIKTTEKEAEDIIAEIMSILKSKGIIDEL